MRGETNGGTTVRPRASPLHAGIPVRPRDSPPHSGIIKLGHKQFSVPLWKIQLLQQYEEAMQQCEEALQVSHNKLMETLAPQKAPTIQQCYKALMEASKESTDALNLLRSRWYQNTPTASSTPVLHPVKVTGADASSVSPTPALPPVKVAGANATPTLVPPPVKVAGAGADANDTAKAKSDGATVKKAVPRWWQEYVERCKGEQAKATEKRRANAAAGVEYIDGRKYEWSPGTIASTQSADVASIFEPTPNYYEALDSCLPSVSTGNETNRPQSEASTISTSTPPSVSARTARALGADTDRTQPP